MCYASSAGSASESAAAPLAASASTVGIAFISLSESYDALLYRLSDRFDACKTFRAPLSIS